jgi:hypothetical protein
MIRFLRSGLVLLALAGVLALGAACGSDDGDDDGSDEPTATSEAPGDGDEPTATDDGGSGSGDASDELDALAEEFGDREMKVTYDLTSSDGTTTTYTIYWKSADSWRVDFDADGATTSMIASGGLAYICSSDGAGGGQCIESPGGASAIPVPFFGALTQENGLAGLITGAFAGVDVDTSEETIAGRDASCYKVSGSVAGDEGYAEICSGDGILLRWSGGSAGADATIEATAVEDTVADADLELPYEILQIPGT